MVKKIIKQQNGQSTFLFISLFFIISLFFTYFAAHQYYQFQQLKNRVETYLCFKFLNHNQKNYSQKMALTNKTLIGIYPFTLIPATAPAARTAQKTLMLGQTVLHLSYLKELMNNHYCTLQQASFYIKNIPYKHLGPVLKRNSRYVVLQRKKKWTNYIISKSKPYFVIQSNFQHKNHLTKVMISSTKEVEKDLQFLKQSFGLQ